MQGYVMLVVRHQRLVLVTEHLALAGLALLEHGQIVGPNKSYSSAPEKQSGYPAKLL